jgi:signal transduction histidine kinase
LLAATLDSDAAIKFLAQLMIPAFADYWSVYVYDEHGTPRCVDRTASSVTTFQMITELGNKYDDDPRKMSGFAQVLETGETLYVAEVDNAMITAFVSDPGEAEIMRKLGLQSSIIAALRARGRILGVVALNMTDSGRHYSRADVEFAEELARRAGLAIDNARLYQQAQKARQNAEQAANRIARLQAATAALSEVLTPAQVADVIIQQAVTTLGAAAGSVAQLSVDGQMLNVLKTVGYAQELAAVWTSFPLDSNTPLTDVVLTGQPLWFENFNARIVHYPHLAQIFDQGDHGEAWAAVPLIVDQQIVGAMNLSFTQPTRFTDEDREFILALAHQCAQALQRARLYEGEQQARTQAEAAIQARDDFLSVAAHELRTPVTSLIGFTQTLIRRLDHEETLDANRVRHTLSVIEQQSTKLARLITQLLDISRIDSGRLMLDRRWTNLSTLVDSVASSNPTVGTRHPITLHTPPDIYTSVDPLRFEQVITNLVDNAVKYSPQGGPITLELAQPDASMIQLSISDSGIGIPAEHKERIFERFYQAHKGDVVGGLGLGLFISRQIIQMHGGTIHVESLTPKGTRFVITLPVIEAVISG